MAIVVMEAMGQRIESTNASPFHVAARKGHANVIKKLLERKGKAADRVDTEDEFGITPLLVAAYCGNLGCVRELLKGGADAKHKAIYGITALHLFSQRPHIRPEVRLAIGKALKEKGADLYAEMEI